jgi:hypothetical protein
VFVGATRATFAFKQASGNADLQIMHRGEAFGDILAEKLRDASAERPALPGVRAGFASVSSSIKLDGNPRFHFRATPYSRIPGATQGKAGHAPFVAAYLSSAVAPPSTPASRTPRRILSPRHQRALDALVGFGAALHADFTEAELRSAFRALARRYHPDRHPGSNAAERSRLTPVFAGLADHYRDLLAVTRAASAVN